MKQLPYSFRLSCLNLGGFLLTIFSTVFSLYDFIKIDRTDIFNIHIDLTISLDGGWRLNHDYAAVYDHGIIYISLWR